MTGQLVVGAAAGTSGGAHRGQGHWARGRGEVEEYDPG